MLLYHSLPRLCSESVTLFKVRCRYSIMTSFQKNVQLSALFTQEASQETQCTDYWLGKGSQSECKGLPLLNQWIACAQISFGSGARYVINFAELRLRKRYLPVWSEKQHYVPFFFLLFFSSDCSLTLNRGVIRKPRAYALVHEYMHS